MPGYGPPGYMPGMPGWAPPGPPHGMAPPYGAPAPMPVAPSMPQRPPVKPIQPLGAPPMPYNSGTSATTVKDIRWMQRHLDGAVGTIGRKPGEPAEFDTVAPTFKRHTHGNDADLTRRTAVDLSDYSQDQVCFVVGLFRSRRSLPLKHARTYARTHALTHERTCPFTHRRSSKTWPTKPSRTRACRRWSDPSPASGYRGRRHTLDPRRFTAESSTSAVKQESPAPTRAPRCQSRNSRRHQRRYVSFLWMARASRSPSR
jgi:hypothetical protein